MNLLTALLFTYIPASVLALVCVTAWRLETTEQEVHRIRAGLIALRDEIEFAEAADAVIEELEELCKSEAEK